MAQVLLLRQPNEPGSEPGAAVASNALPVLHAVEQIKRLAREEWQRSYPVKIRGVITTVLDSGFFIQDSTASVYARWRAPTDYDAPRLGDLWEIEGATFAEFAPNVQVSRATRLGPGTMPEPLRPTWDQLINGSLDTEYVEVQGIITSVSSDHVTLLTRSGKISLELPDLQPQQLAQHQNALVRVRGCVMPVRDIKTQQVIPGQLRLANAAITADEPPPANPFALRLKHVSDLLRFDLRAGAFQRVKIAGQLVHLRDGQLFLMDGSDGSRVIPTSMAGLQVGDMVEVVGFPDLGKPSPLLREAVVRRVGSARLPEPVLLPSPPPLNRRYDGTIVRVQALLAAVSSDHSDQLLELQSSSRSFFARLKTSAGSLPAISPGSLLELTGIYDGQGNDLALAPEINAFELLLNSPADVKVLARPSWWTVRHTLTLLGAMGLVILVGMVWIALLRRQVEERSNQLAVEIRRHEVSERQRELEAERARIARDLHDDLGATLTQIRFLSAVESRDSQLPETTRSRMGQVSEKSREMVTSLDEIVWAVNPANDSLPNLANYLCHFAEEFFRPTPIRCRLDVDEVLPMASLTSEVRHNLYLAVREALNNIAKHSQATEVWFRIHFQEPGKLCLTITDNGRGFSSTPDGLSGDGLANMRRRLMQIGGRFECENQAVGGVVCQFWLPVETRPSLKS
jgi:signal transduction histidine kinase